MKLMAIKIIKGGLFTSVQDKGRTGYRALGIGPGGSMDPCAASVANWLVGNGEGVPVIEMHFPAAEFHFEQEAVIAVTGANFSPHINNEPIQLCKPCFINKNSTLSFKRYCSGARSYLAIQGGMNLEAWLGSYSTHSKIGAGGYKGRIFIKDDILVLNQELFYLPDKEIPNIAEAYNSFYRKDPIVQCIEGPEWDLMKKHSRHAFTPIIFTISNQSDRMGYRLNGEILELENPAELISSAVDFGTIQLLPNGQVIVLMADHQTTGGYPRIATVISSELPGLSQLPIHSKIRFELIPIEKAEEALISMNLKLLSIKKNCFDFYDKD